VTKRWRTSWWLLKPRSSRPNEWPYEAGTGADSGAGGGGGGANIRSFLSFCKGTYACVRPHRYTYGNYRNTVANVDASDSRCRCICKIIARDLWLVASRLYRMAVTRPGSRAAITLSPSLGAPLLGCINHTRGKEGKH
jgi:hypothetical protein